MAKSVYIREEVEIPAGVEVRIEGKKIRVSGPKGVIERDFSFAHGVQIRMDNNRVILESFIANRRLKALLYSIAAHINNMIVGVTKGWRYKLRVVTSHFPVTVRISGNEILIENFLGEKTPRRAKIIEGVKVKMEGKDIIVVEGIDIEKVAQTAANIELATRVKDKDRRIFVDGVYIFDKGVIE